MWVAALILSLLSIAMATLTTTNLSTLLKILPPALFGLQTRKRKHQPFPLLALPPEIRLQIYRYALPQHQTIIMTKPSAAYCPFPPSSSPLSMYLPAVYEKLHYNCPCQTRLTPPFLPLLQTCRLVRKEAEALFYANNAFVLNIDMPGTLLRIPELLDLLENREGGRRIWGLIRDFRIRVGGNVMVDVCGPKDRWKRYGRRVLVARMPEDAITGLVRGEEYIGTCVGKVLSEAKVDEDGVSAGLIRNILDQIFWNYVPA
ncbi:hypothetical protein E4T48_08200 [Aureobasidium sp. EXF-10727]|nr:hypothetical protein E4T48_08200 [Aureobasidium sp. EXF-10727]